MSAARPDGQRAERHIAVIPPAAQGAEQAAQAIQLVESMLWALRGTLRSDWVAAATAEAADVVVISNGTRDERLKSWEESGKPVIVVAAAGEAPPAATHVLVYPFRATQLLQLLNDLDTRLAASSQVAANSSTSSQTAKTRAVWSFVESLRTLREVQNAAVWITASQGQLPVLWLKGDGSEYSADASTLQDIRRGSLAFGALKLRQSPAPPAHRGLRPTTELEWFAGFHASSELAPWLDPATAFRIVRWPNFGLIRPLPSQIRITALLSSAPLTLEQIVRRSGMPRVEAIRTLNALESCNLLAAVDRASAAPATPRAPTPQPPGGLAAFVRLVRKRLGLDKGT